MTRIDDQPQLAAVCAELGFVCLSPRARELCQQAEAAARQQGAVLIVGEPGSGKQMIARLLHAASDRRDGPFVPVNCSALTGTLFESQLFGHARGSFNGAAADSIGFLQSAHGGTLFLDEIGHIGLVAQARLLGVLPDRFRTGIVGELPKAVDVRVVSATSDDLTERVREGLFRGDLLSRLSEIRLEVPPLRSRFEDILPLAGTFLTNLAEFYDEPAKQLNDDVCQAFHRYRWPGNVHELVDVVEHLVSVQAGQMADLSDLPLHVLRDIQQAKSDGIPAWTDAERTRIAQAIEQARREKPIVRKLGAAGLDPERDSKTHPVGPPTDV